MKELLNNFSPSLQLLIGCTAIFLSVLILTQIVLAIFRWYQQRRESREMEVALDHLGSPLRWFVPLLSVVIFVSTDFFSMEWKGKVLTGLIISLYTVGGWLLVKVVDVVAAMVRYWYKIDSFKNINERKIVTQFQYIKRVFTVVIIFIVVALSLLQFERVRELGSTLIASAGVAGIIIGFAAQKSISNLLAGFQLAFTQPIRVDDVVVVEGEWGRIEEITLTYVIVAIWDERRLVVPLNYFNEHPFQNWTRESSQILTYIYIYTDYRLPVDGLRERFFQLLDESDLWDERVRKVHVTNADRQTIEIRPLMSTADASSAWELKCWVREKLIQWIRENHPECLPRTRIQLEEANAALAIDQNGVGSKVS